MSPPHSGLDKRRRWTPTEEAKALLETVFSADAFPSFAVRMKLAEQLSIDSRQVQIWFQNRRQRQRLKEGSLRPLADQGRSESDDGTGDARNLCAFSQSGEAGGSSEPTRDGAGVEGAAGGSESSAPLIIPADTPPALQAMVEELPQGTPAALVRMLGAPGGPRALRSAARGLLLSNPLLQHPGAPCHALLSELASLGGTTDDGEQAPRQ